MGYYTELYVSVKLKSNTPEKVINLFDRVINERDLGVDSEIFHAKDVFVPDIGHDFFKCSRWYMLLLANNWDDKKSSTFIKGEYPELEIFTEFKDCDDEIEKFVDFISPYVVGRKDKQYIGWYKDEGMETRSNLYVVRNER